MRRRLFGSETEYALTAFDRGGAPLDRGWALRRFLAVARARLLHASDLESRGLFLANGSRLYLDHGHHPELSTPECTNPWDGVRYVLAGHRILADTAAATVAAEPRIDTLVLTRCNVDYSGRGTTWGCHESYLTTMAPRAIAAQLIPHLVSRIVFSGAGGFDNRSAGLAFSVSPRAHHLPNASSHDSTDARGILHTKDEPLCTGFHRLHLICGESLCSETATWLKLGTTALVVALIEAGVGIGTPVAPRKPVVALQTFAADPTAAATVPTLDGVPRSAIDIQRHYLEHAEAHVTAPFMPRWAAPVCARWRTVLEQLADDPTTLATTLDWPLKLALFERHARRRGLAWEAVPLWTSVVDQLTWEIAPDARRAASLTADDLLGVGGPTGVVRRLTPLLRRSGLSWHDLQAFLDVRHELLELDTRFGQLDTGGIFATLDRAGTLAHHVPGVDDVAGATHRPPAGGRASLRGAAIDALARAGKTPRATWGAVWDDAGGRCLDLGDPFARTPRWVTRSTTAEDTLSLTARLRRRLQVLRWDDDEL